MATKEEIYDQQIHPLMDQIIGICKEHKIANLCSFSLSTDGDGLSCTTAMLADEFDPPANLLASLDMIRREMPAPLVVTVTKKDGSKEIDAVL